MLPLILNRAELETRLTGLDLLPAIRAAFVAYSRGEAVVPPVGELLFDKPPGDVHLKYGYLKNGACYVVKIASGFYDNPKLGLPSSGGLFLVFNKTTGQTEAVLLDDGLLTDHRTAAAGAVAAQALAPLLGKGDSIGILGTGIQARLQAHYLKRITACRNVILWGRNAENTQACAKDLKADGFNITLADSPQKIAASARLIVTTTPSQSPLLRADDIQPGTHITAVGADSPGKQELDAAILAQAELYVADSIAQCAERGELAHTLAAGLMKKSEAIELGTLLEKPELCQRTPDAITIADLTGVAVQDIAIAEAILS